MTAWGCTGAAMIWRLVLMILSRTGITKKTPGPLAPMQRPSRKITPRSNSWTILIDVARKATTTNTMRTPALNSACTVPAFLRLPFSVADRLLGGPDGDRRDDH